MINYPNIQIFDVSILYFLNSFVGVCPKFDSFVELLVDFNPIKMGPMVLILWGFWFQHDTETLNRRAAVIRACLGCVSAMLIARLCALFALFRLRPLHNPELLLKLNDGMNHTVLDGWSSFPSDHAALGFALATSIFFIHRRWGIFALVHTVIIICLPRMYLSLHYPTDIIAGALIGICSAWIVMKADRIKSLAKNLLRFEKSHSVFFYLLLFIFTSQMMQMFKDVRNLTSFVVKTF